MEYQTGNLKFVDTGSHSVVVYVDDNKWGSPQGSRFFKALLKDIKQYRSEIIRLRGKAHLSCPKCYEDCQSWIIDGAPCNEDW